MLTWSRPKHSGAKNRADICGLLSTLDKPKINSIFASLLTRSLIDRVWDRENEYTSQGKGKVMYTNQHEMIAVEVQGMAYRVVSYGNGAAYSFHGGKRSVFFQDDDADRFGQEIEALLDHVTTDADLLMLKNLWADYAHVSTPDA